MIEPKDASKCDERHVKNKPYVLTKKRKGDINTMLRMNHWNLVLFFVVGLMLSVGMFAETASAQQVQVVTVTDLTAVSGEERDVKVTYRVIKRIPAGNTITINLPTDWAHAHGTGFGTMGDLKVNGDFTSLDAGESTATTSYVIVNTPYRSTTSTLATQATALTAEIATNAVTVTLVANPDGAGDTDDYITMVPGNIITVTYYNAKVKRVTEEDFEADGQAAAGDGTETRNPVGAQLTVTDTRGTVDGTTYGETRTGLANVPNYDSRTLFKVSPPALSSVTVRDLTADSEEVRDVVVTYRVKAKIEGGNTITIDLPDDWEHAHGTGFGTMGDLKVNGDFTSLDAGESTATTSYVIVNTPYRSTTSTLATQATALTAEIATNAVTVTLVANPDGAGDTDDYITMVPGNIITVTYHNAKVKRVTEEDFEADGQAAADDGTETRNPVGAQLIVTDGIVRSSYVDGDGTTVSLYNPDTLFKVSPPELSSVTVADRMAKSEEVRDVKVTYRVGDMLYAENVITIPLPTDWEAAYDGSFGTTIGDIVSTSSSMVSSLPSPLPAGKTEDMLSYVTVEYDGATGVEDYAGITLSSTEVVVTVAGGMATGKEVIVTYHNVKVPRLSTAEAMEARLTVRDSIVRSDYTDDGVIEVNLPDEADVSVDLPPARSEATISSVTVTYQVTDIKYDGNIIEIGLPDGWEAAFEDFGNIGNIDLADETEVSSLTEGADMTETSYVTVEYDPVGRDRTNTANVDISGEMVTIIVDGDMMKDDEIIVKFFNVMVEEVMGRDAEDLQAQLTVRDSIMGLETKYDADTVITLIPPELSKVAVSPPEVIAEVIEDEITVTYTVKDTVIGGNIITVELPEDWENGYGSDFGDIAADDSIDLDGDSTATLAVAAVKMVSSLPDSLPTGMTEDMLSYVKVEYDAAGRNRDNTATVGINGNEVKVMVSDDMMRGDEIIVKFFNAKVQEVIGREPVTAQFMVTDTIVGMDDKYDAMAQIIVRPPKLSDVTVSVPSAVQASSIVTTVKVTYKAMDPIAEENEIIVDLPANWEAAYANDGGDGEADFGRFDDFIDLDGDSTATPAVAAVKMVSTMPATLATGASASKTSYVTVEYTPRGTSMNTADVSIRDSEVMIPVEGNMAAMDRIVVTYHNVKVPALSDTAAEVSIVVMDKLSPTGSEYVGEAKIEVDAPDLNAVKVTPTTAVPAETVTDVTVTYSIKDTVVDENTITVGLPEGWMPAYLPNDESSLSTRSFGDAAESTVPTIANGRNSTSYVVVTSTLDDDEFTVSTLALSDANASLTIDVEDTAVRGDNIVVTFNNVKVRGLSSRDTTLPAKDMVMVEDTIAGGKTYDGETDKTTIMVTELKRGRITRLPSMVTAEDELDLRIRYTATEDLADPDPDGDEDTADATYGRIQIMLPDGWVSADGTLSETDVIVTVSSSVELSADDNDPATPHNPDEVTDGVITIDVDSLKDGKYVDIAVNNLRVADFPADEAGDKIYVQVEVLSDSFDSAAAREIDLGVPEAHLSSKFAPKVAFTAATATAAAYGSDVHPTIVVNRKYLGEVAVTPASVVAEATTDDVKVRYTATNTLADPSDSDTATVGVQPTSFGRVQITLPEGWGPESVDDIYLTRQASNRTATYLSLRKSSGVTAVALSDASVELDGDRYRINIDVNAMRSRQWVELTVHNLIAAPLEDERTGSFDPDITAPSELVQVEVFSETFSVVGDRDNATELMSPMAHSPVKGKFTPHVAAEDKGSDTQPTVKVTRKQLGKVAISPLKVSAGKVQDFTITYTASEMLVENSVIEVRLPNWGGDDHSGVPTAYQIDDLPAKKDDRTKPNVHLSGSKSRLEGSTVAVQEDGDTSIVRIVLGEKGLAKNNSVTLKFEGATVQRQIAVKKSDAEDDRVAIEVFSSDSVDLGVPQYPVEKPEEDKIEVTHAADGSGKVMFEFEGLGVKAFAPKTKAADRTKPENHSNTDASVSAGLTKDDTFDLIVTYMPEGDMVGESGTAEFQITLPGNWQAEDVRSSGSDVSRSGNTITAKLKDHFGEIGESLEIVLEGITTPDDHGNDRFVAKSRNAKGSLKQLSPVPMVFVGNTLADNDTMSVEIDPLAAYEGEEDVDFEITLTANGPMHDSDIQITVPDGIEGLQTGESGDPNYVRKVAPAGSGVVVRVDDANDENIFITTGKLNKGGTIIVRLNNVDIDGDVSTDNATGFRVNTRTRGTDGDAADGDDGDKHNLTDVAWELIEKDDGARSIVGGEIRTITGSGAIAFKPATVQQGSRNVDFDFTFTASTAFSNKTLTIVAPSVIETPLVETAGDGQVTVSGGRYHSDVEAKARLVVSDDTITVAGLILRKGERFAIKVNNVDLFGRTGEFRWAVTLDGTALRDADNPPMVVVGTMQSDVAFEIVDETGAPISAPEYNAASQASIRFRFTAENTVIQKGGTLRFTVPAEWSLPSVTARANRATVSIVHVKDGAETFVSKVADKWALSARGRNVTLTIDPKGKLDPGSSVIIRYGTPDTTKYPVQISDSVKGTVGSDEDGLSIKGYYRVSSATGFPERATDLIRVDITNVEDGTGTATVTPPSVRADSIDNLIRVVYTAIGTMDGGAVRITIPQTWGNPQNDDPEEPNYVKVTVSSGATLTSEVLHDEGRFVQANLTTFGAGDNVSFTYGGGRGASKGAVAQADLGEVVFLVESRGGSDGTFEAIVDDMGKAVSPIVEVKSAKSGSGKVAVTVMNNKSGSVVYDGVAERRIFAGDDKTYLVLTYTAEQTIAEGEFELIVPRGWTAPQQDDTNRPGYTYLEEGNALVSNEEYNGQSVTATIEMERGDVIKIHYGWYATENGGAHAPQAAGTSVFRVEFDGVAVASQPTVTVHGGTASKLVVTAPSEVSADLGTAPVAITVEIQDDTNAIAVAGTDLEVTLNSTSSTGTFTDADGEAIVDNTVTISAGSTEATAYYSDTAAGTATVRATAVGLDSGRATIEVTSDIDTVDENSISVSPAVAKAGDRVTVTARGTAGKTATFSVGAVVTTMMMTESSAGSYSGSFNVVQDQHDGTHNVTVAIGDASAMGANAVTIDTNAPTISGASASPSTVGNGDTVTISATVTGATSVTADVSALDDTKTDVTLTMANGSYSASVTISDDNEALNGSKTITVTATDAAGNSAMATAMVTLENKLSYTSMIPAGQSLFHVPLAVDGMDTVGALKAALGDAVNLALVYDSAAGSWDARSDNVMITADLGIILATSAAVTHTFEGQPWGGGTSTISLKAGSNNLIGLPVNDPRVTNVSDIMSLFTSGVITSIVAGTGDPAEPFKQVIAGTSSDGPVMGDAAYLVTATADATAAVIGKGWSSAAMGAAPVALAGYNVDDQTAVLDVQGAVVDEITGLAREGFRVKVKNLSTKASLSKVTSVEMAEGYNMTFVDLKAANAARIGDVLEIYADSPNPLIGVKPVRHIVTVDDVKNSTIQLENLIAYEIPAETELLRNYPNPFNPETWIPYYLAEDADVNLRIYALSGELVRDIDVGHQTAAKYDTRSKAIYWDGRNSFGEQVASGVYFYSLSAGDFSATRKMVILK